MTKENTKKQGVYAIRNMANGKMYIGSTINPFYKRWQCHKKRLKKGVHHSAHLQASWNKYGESNFSFEIVEITAPELCREREGFYITLYKTTNPKYGYNTATVTEEGVTEVSNETKTKLSTATKQQWRMGLHSNDFKKGKPSWNKGLKCNNISKARRSMFSSVEVYKNDTLIATFRSATDLDEWTKHNELPGIVYYCDKAGRPNIGKRTTHILSQNIHRAVRTGLVYRGFRFKKSLPLPPEMGVVKWENCWNGEIPNQQPSLESKNSSKVQRLTPETTNVEYNGDTSTHHPQF